MPCAAPLPDGFVIRPAGVVGRASNASYDAMPRIEDAHEDLLQLRMKKPTGVPARGLCLFGVCLRSGVQRGRATGVTALRAAGFPPTGPRTVPVPRPFLALLARRRHARGDR